MSYKIGKNRIFYQSNNDEEKSIEINFLNPNLEQTENFLMNKHSSKTYYYDICFRYEGPYLVTIFEDGIRKLQDIFRIEKQGSSMIVYPEETNII